ncbi:hypothetical protein J2X41_003083 [Caulobacter sp. BE254]|nr:hypothetical protein [Caulobacter sp. BE254]
MTPWMALGTCTHPEAVNRSARPCRESTSPACAQRSANKASRFQHPELSRPDLVPTLPDPRILIPPRRRERAHGQRPMRRRGAIEREAPSAVLMDQTSRLWSRSGLEHKNDVARGLAEQQAGGDALAVRDRGSLTWPARRRLQGGEVRTGLSAAGFRITSARSDRLRRNGNSQNTPDDVRRSASLSISSAASRVRRRSRASQILPLWGRCRPKGDGGGG